MPASSCFPCFRRAAFFQGNWRFFLPILFEQEPEVRLVPHFSFRFFDHDSSHICRALRVLLDCLQRSPK